MRTLYVGGLEPDATVDHLRNLFSDFGEVVDARIVMRSSTGRCRGFGYVTLATESAALAAKAALDGRALGTVRLRVELAR